MSRATVRVVQCRGSMGDQATSEDVWSFIRLLEERIAAVYPDVDLDLDECDQGCDARVTSHDPSVTDEMLETVRTLSAYDVWEAWCGGARAVL